MLKVAKGGTHPELPTGAEHAACAAHEALCRYDQQTAREVLRNFGVSQKAYDNFLKPTMLVRPNAIQLFINMLGRMTEERKCSFAIGLSASIHSADSLDEQPWLVSHGLASVASSCRESFSAMPPPLRRRRWGCSLHRRSSVRQWQLRPSISMVRQEGGWNGPRLAGAGGAGLLFHFGCWLGSLAGVVVQTLHFFALERMSLRPLPAEPHPISCPAAALAHQADFDVCWCKGSVSDKIFLPLVERIKAAGGSVQVR